MEQQTAIESPVMVTLSMGGNFLPRAVAYLSDEFVHYANQVGIDASTLPETYSGMTTEVESPNGVAYVHPAIVEGDAICPILQLEESCTYEHNASDDTVTYTWHSDVITPFKPAVDGMRQFVNGTVNRAINDLHSGKEDYVVAMQRDMEAEARWLLAQADSSVAYDMGKGAPTLFNLTARANINIIDYATELLAHSHDYRTKAGKVMGDGTRANAILDDIEAAGDTADYATLITELWETWMSPTTLARVSQQ